MSDSSDPLAWVARAEEDYTVVRLSLRHKKPLLYSACFHAQQCAEKYLKAILVSRHHAFPKTHDLRLLENLCTSAGILVPVDNALLDTLSSYAVRVRYPGDDPTLDEAKEAQKIAKAVRRFVRKLLGLK
ncbi:MAG: HEPN domain-containing protein [Ardenticatenaceae bacterium]